MSKLKKALERAKDQRETSPAMDAVPPVPLEKRQVDETIYKKGPSLSEIKKEPREEPRESAEGVKVTYTKTQVRNIDPETLKRNKIYSISHDHELTDHINLLRAQVMNGLKKIGGNSILITSANPGEGKTFTAINLAVSIAKELNRTVLLVDADLKNPTIHHYDFATDFFGVNLKRGLADYLLGQEELPDLLVNPGIEKLTILPAGHALPNSSELLGSPRMEAMIKDIKNRYQKERIVIFDCSSLLASPDPLVFSHLVDSVLLVVEVGRTTPDQIKRVMELLDGRHVLGTVLNKNRGKKEAHV